MARQARGPHEEISPPTDRITVGPATGRVAQLDGSTVRLLLNAVLHRRVRHVVLPIHMRDDKQRGRSVLSSRRGLVALLNDWSAARRKPQKRKFVR